MTLSAQNLESKVLISCTVDFFFCLSVCLDLDIWYDMLWCRYLIYTCSCLCGQDNISCTYVYIQLIDEFVLKA